MNPRSQTTITTGARAGLTLLAAVALAGCSNTAPAPPRQQPPPGATASQPPSQGQVELRTGRGVDAPAREVVQAALSGDKPDAAEGSSVLLGSMDDPEVTGALREAGGNPKAKPGPEGYAMAVDDSGGKTTAVLAGADPAGQFYAAQRFAELTGSGSLRPMNEVAEPELRKRGAIEGFYGPPWTQQDRLDQLEFYGDKRLNTYIYSPKDDPKLRAQWREPYTEAEIAELKELVDTAKRNHVTFTYALSPGLSICYSDKGERKAVQDKFQQLYDIGVRDFNLPLDDIEYKWADGCADQQRYGEPTEGNVATAHAELSNVVQREFIRTHQGTTPLEMVPTDYSGLEPSAYTEALKSTLDPAIAVMWTGKFVVPASISAPDARAARGLYGRKPYIWDNYPVNDFDFGRLMLGPYTHRGADLPAQTSGIVLNPMPEAAPSKVALATFADYAWQGTAYKPYASRDRAADYLAGGDKASAQALRAFFDTENLPARPESYDDPALEPQAPILADKIAAFERAYRGDDKQGAVAKFRPYAKLLATAQQTLTNGPTDPLFVKDSKEWLDALTLWGKALNQTLDGLAAKASGNQSDADAAFGQAQDLADRAAAVTTKQVTAGDPPEPVQVADGVLDTFLQRAPRL